MFLGFRTSGGAILVKRVRMQINHNMQQIKKIVLKKNGERRRKIPSSHYHPLKSSHPFFKRYVRVDDGNVSPKVLPVFFF